MARRSDHSRSELRTLILNAACRIIEAEGLRGLTIRRIAKDVGYTSGTLYQVFRNLDDLIFETHVLSLNELYAVLEQVEITQDPEASLYALAQGYLQFAAQNQNRWNALFTHALLPGQELPEQYDAALSRLFKLVVVALNPIFPEPNSDQAFHEARVLWSSLYGIVALETLSKLSRFENVETFTGSLIRNYVAGLRANIAGHSNPA